MQSLSNSPPLKVTRYGHMRIGSWWRYYDCRSIGWVLEMASAPGAAIETTEKRWDLPPNQALLIPPNLVFHTIPGDDIPLTWVHFHNLNIGLPTDRPTLLRSDSILTLLAQELPHAQQYGTDVYTALAIAAQAIGIAISSQPERDRQRILHTIASHEPLRPALEYIADHFTESIYVSTLADLCGHGPQWFARTFKDTYGCTPTHYILIQRVEMAASRLAASEASLDDIAAATGFNDRFHLTRIFSKIMGTPPAAWRKAGRSDGIQAAFPLQM